MRVTVRRHAELVLRLALGFRRFGDERFYWSEVDGDTRLYYSPGHAIIHKGKPKSDQLRRLRGSAERAAASIPKGKRNVALILFLHNDCNCDCGYCPRDSGQYSGQQINWEHVRGHLGEVIDNCRRIGEKAVVAFHGWGEPLLHYDQIAELSQRIDEEIEKAGLQRFFYIATNGLLDEKRLKLISDRFDLVGLSCDGDPDTLGGRGMARGANDHQAVRSTAAALRSAGKRFDVRMTVTPDTAAMLPDSVRYIARELSPSCVRLEPQYAMKGTPVFLPEMAVDFYRYYSQAREVAAAYGYDIRPSLCRPEELHGPYCNPLRGVCNLLPDGLVTPCFADIDGQKSELYSTRGNDVSRLQRMPDSCLDCFNRYHCIRGCPEFCPLDSDYAPDGGFRCLLAKMLAVDWMLDMCAYGA